jgi:hypothetical protein
MTLIGQIHFELRATQKRTDGRMDGQSGDYMLTLQGASKLNGDNSGIIGAWFYNSYPSDKKL